MSLRDILIPMLRARFPDRGLQLGGPPGHLAVFPAAHPDVGPASVALNGDESGADVAVGSVAQDSFFNPYEEEHGTAAAAQGVAQNVIRFLEELFADRLLMWRSDDGATLGWRERGDAGHTAPLVVDDRMYHTYIWTRPLGTWQATPTILARGRILDDREYEIMVQRATDDGPDRLPPGPRDLARHLVAEYEREMRAQRSAEGEAGTL